MSDARPVGVGVVGLGFMGRTHVAAYRAAAAAGHPNDLVAVCDALPERLAARAAAAGNLAAARADEAALGDGVARYERAEELLADPRVELVSVCTPTDTHVPLAVAALEAGKHVLVEKPVALDAAGAARLAAAARASDRLCMPALCMRFWPGWTWLRDRVADGTLGAVRSATFRRLASFPAWSAETYGDPARTGGALLDLHVHDADFVRWCFGDPRSVVAAGTEEHVTALYRYGPAGPAHVVAEGGWDHAVGWPFRMEYVVVFERGTAEFDLRRDPPLVLVQDGATEAVELPAGSGYDGEVRHLLDAVARGAPLAATPEDAVAHLRLLEAERESLRSGREVALGGGAG